MNKINIHLKKNKFIFYKKVLNLKFLYWNILFLGSFVLCADIATATGMPLNEVFVSQPIIVEADKNESQLYVIGAGDEIEITVLGYPELSTKAVVLPDGFISFPYIGNLKAEGLNSKALADIIQKNLDTYIYNPEVSVKLIEMRSKRFSVIGEVRKPGTFPLWDRNLSIYEAISLAEGFLPSAYAQQVYIIRKDNSGKTTRINLDLTDKSITQPNAFAFTLQSGDVVSVPSQLEMQTVGIHSKRYSVLGEVKKPGVFSLSDTDVTIYEAISQAEGFLQTAYPEQVRIMREDESGEKTTINLNLANTNRNQTDITEIKLQPGDIVFVPGQSEMEQVCVIGKVSTPGRYRLSQGMTIIDALTAAGWITKEGVSNSVILGRRSADKRELTRINAQEIITKQDGNQDVLLQSGDIVYVPEKFISKVSDFIGYFTSNIEPAAHTYLRVYDAVNPASVVIDR